GIGNILLASYVPNKRPNKQFRGSALGYADVQGLESILASIDSALSSWIRDIELGRGRIIVPDHFLDFDGEGNASFDAHREVFAGLPLDPNTATNNPITLSQFQIRM